MSIVSTNKLNRLMTPGNPGGLYFSAWLTEKGYSNQLINKYRNSGWLQTLSKGVMYRTGDKLNSFAVINSYNEQMKKDFHIAAHSALELSGFSHYLPMGKPVLMVAHPKKQIVPEWVKKIDLDRELNFFSTETFSKPQTDTFNSEFAHLKSSVPELAFLECLLLAPRQYSLMDLYYLMEQLTSLRPDVLQLLLENTDNIKTKRLFLYMAEKAEHHWYSLLDTSKIELGSGKQQLVEKGVYHSKYKITIPQELYDYE
jgi:hypothetical protein